MLHGYKKSRYNIYDNLEFLGLNFYEQKHFCFGEGEGDGCHGQKHNCTPNKTPPTVTSSIAMAAMVRSTTVQRYIKTG